MFTGIIETMGTILSVSEEGSNKTFWIKASFTHELKVDQSVAHDGVCLTVTDIHDDTYSVTAIAETLRKTRLGQWIAGNRVNLERCMTMNGRLDGHIVQGHVDTTATCESVVEENGSWLFQFHYDPSCGHITVPKGSICVNGVSLTVVNSSPGSFSVAIIPYTWEHTNFHELVPGSTVNLEFDIIGKYVHAWMSQRQS
jgi:riboflavin synthase